MSNPETGLATREAHVIAIPNYDQAVRSLQQRRDLVLRLMESTLKDGVHYGKIPGCGDKPSLFLTGAEQLSAAFQFCPRYKVERHRDAMHMTVDITCELYTPGGDFIGEGVGTCSTYESKYRWRAQKTAENTGELVPKKYWDLRKSEKKEDKQAAQELIGGPGFQAKKDETNTWVIFKVAATGEREENPDIADQWNTVLKMGAKRAFVHAVRTATGTADIYTQDIEDFTASYGNIIDAEVVTYDPPGFGTNAGAAPQPEPPKADPPKDEPRKNTAPPPPAAEKERPAPEDRPAPETVKKNAEEFANGVSPETAPSMKKDRYGNPIPAVDSTAFGDYTKQRLNNACGLYAAQYYKLAEGTDAERKEKAKAQAITRRDDTLKELQKGDKFTGNESQFMKMLMMAEAMEARYDELFKGL